MKRASLLVLLSLVTISAEESHSAAVEASFLTRIAAAVNGDITLFGANGRFRQVLTGGGLDSSPVESPDGRAVAFQRAPYGGPTQVRRIMLASPTGRDGYRISRFSQRDATTSRGHFVVWEPGLHAPGLAWYDANTVQYRRAGGNQQTVLNLGPPSASDPSGSITFSSDDSAIAAPAAPSHAGSGPARALHVAVRHFNGTPQRAITIRFRRHILGTGDPTRGSFPVGDSLTYTNLRFPSRLHTLEFPTIAMGAGYQVTGLFVAPDTGGTARMVLGNGHGVHGIPPFGAALEGATHFQYAPNGKYVATDPNNDLSIGGEVARPLIIRVPRARSCVVAQWTWLPDSSGLAYVTACTVSGSSPLHYRLTLGTVMLNGGTTTILDSIESANPQAIDLAPSYRCVACG